MLVRAKRTHFTDTIRKEGDEWEHKGKLYEHIEVVKQNDKPASTDDNPVNANGSAEQ